jgi:peptide/nickel transport system substrate-binding protein
VTALGTLPVARLDPSAYSPGSAGSRAHRLISRQLFGYLPAADPRSWQAVAPVPDLALEIPSIYNAGLGASGTSHVVRLRPGVRWDTDPPRDLVAGDVIRGLKRMGNPVLRSPLLPLFLTTIRGFAEFCAAYADAVPEVDPDPARLAAFQNSHDISGVFALDDATLVFELVRPTLAFANILALPCAAPAPEEYDAVVPSSPAFLAGIRSLGPYRPVEVTPERLRFERNPVWQPATDPLREQDRDGVEFRRPAAEDEHGDDAAAAPGHALDPYLAVNTVSPAGDRALGKRAVRRALAAAIDRTALVEVVREAAPGRAVRPAFSVIPPGNDGYADGAPGSGPDVAAARELLAAAGSAGGLRLTAVCPATLPYPQVARSVAADLGEIGVSVDVVALPPDECRALLDDPEQARRGAWDLALQRWSPCWRHGNRQVFLQPLFQTSTWRGTANCGRYSNPRVDALLAEAAGTVDPGDADRLWRDAERAVADDCPVVPLLFRAPAVARDPLGGRP